MECRKRDYRLRPHTATSSKEAREAKASVTLRQPPQDNPIKYTSTSMPQCHTSTLSYALPFPLLQERQVWTLIHTTVEGIQQPEPGSQETTRPYMEGRQGWGKAREVYTQARHISCPTDLMQVPPDQAFS